MTDRPIDAGSRLACKTKRKFKATTNSKHDLPIAPNQLDRQFTVNQPNQVYAGDITYIPYPGRLVVFSRSD